MTSLLKKFHVDFRGLALSYGDRPALLDGRQNVTLTYTDLHRLIERYGRFFHECGLTPGDAVCAFLQNSTEMLSCFLATSYFGLGFAPITTEAAASEVGKWIALTAPRLVLTTSATRDDVRKKLASSDAQVRDISLDGSFDWLPGQSSGKKLTPRKGGRLYLTTSGSTGEPRAMAIDTDRLWSSGCAFAQVHRFLDEKARFLNILPMPYLGGLFNMGFIPLASGGSVVISEAFSGRSFFDFWQTVERFDVNVLWLVPSIVRGLLTMAEKIKRREAPGSHLNIRACFIGTAPIDLATKERFETVFNIPLLENFGLSETTFISSETLDTRFRRSEGSVGEILPYVNADLAAVMEPDDSGEHPNELRARTPFLFLGYLAKTDTIENGCDEDGWLRTGDLANIENDGRLIIAGRHRDIIKKGGNFVSLREVERLAEKHSSVLDAAAVGVPHDFYGESLILCLKLDGAPPENWASNEFLPWLHANLTKYKWPEKVVIVDEFPLTASGKIRKHVLKEMVS